MTEESIKYTLEYLKKNPQEKSWGIFGGSADVWGGSLSWGYTVQYNPKTGFYDWDDTETAEGCSYSVASFQLTEAELMEKLKAIKE
ncbi:hypothetical protein AD998_06665 [bacterium 336/3]|nr:hypothetical protein AD998_06665 [bacterium 336/3]